MKYLTIENKSLQDVDTSNYRKVTWGCYNFKTNILTLCGQEDEYINGQYPKKPIVTNFNLDTGEKEIILKSLVYDCLWNSEANELVYSSGNAILKYNELTKENKKLYKFSSVRYAPINPSISPNNERLAYLTFKSDTRRIQILDLETGYNIDTRTSCNSYQWLNDDSIIYSTSSGNIKILSISELKSKQTLLNLDYLFKQTGRDSIEIQDRIKQLDKVQQSWTQFTSPRIYNQRIYFLIKSGASKTYSLNSVTTEFNDFRVEHISNDVIERFWLVGNNICMEINSVVNLKYNYYINFVKEVRMEFPNELGIVTNEYYSDFQISILKAINTVHDDHAG